MKYWFPVVLYCCIIFGVSAIPGAQLPQGIPNADKLIHMIEYAILAVLFARALRHTRTLTILFLFVDYLGTRGINRQKQACQGMSHRQWPVLIWVIAVFFTAFYGITDEFHQSFVAGRSSDVADWYADAIGGSVGAAGYLFWINKSRKRSIAAF